MTIKHEQLNIDDVSNIYIYSGSSNFNVFSY